MPELPAGNASLAELAGKAAELLVQHRLADEVLGALIVKFPKRRAEFNPGASSGMDAWMARCLADFQQVPVVGFHNKERMHLDIEKIFIPLAFSSLSARRHAARGEPGLEMQCVDEGEISIERAFSELETRRQEDGAPHQGLAVVGLPGSGKTTLLKHVWVRVYKGEWQSLGLPAPLVPVFLRFAGLAAQALAGADLGALVAAEAGASFEAGDALFFLDGLDEVPSPEAREQVCHWLMRELRRPRWAGSRFVITCRYSAWGDIDGVLRDRLLPLTVLDLDEAGMLTYIARWFERVPHAYDDAMRSRAQRTMEAAELKAALLAGLKDFRHPAADRLLSMSRNPLLLSLLCLVAWRKREIPRRRAELYRECLGVLLESHVEHKAREERGELGYRRRFDAVSAMAALHPLAWALQVAGDGRAATALDEAAVLGLLGPAMSNVRELASVPPEEFLHAVSDSGCGVLLSPKPGHYRFFHLTFQEYLAALNAAARGAAAELAARLGDPGWRETVLLSVAAEGLFRPLMAAALARRDAQEHRDLLRLCLDEADVVDVSPFVEVLVRAGVPPPSSWRRLRAWLSGPASLGRPSDATVAMVLGLFATRPHPEIRQAAKALVDHPDASVAAGARELVGRKASRTGMPEPGELWTLELDGLRVPFVWVPPGEFWMGATMEEGKPGFDEQAQEDEAPVRRVKISEGFWLGQHPVTNALYRRYVEERAAAGQEAQEPARSREPRFNQPEQPVVAVSWTAAQDFCAWLSGRVSADRGPVTLPSEAQWEWAARGPESRRYPWGDAEPTPERAVFGLNWRRDGPAPVGGRPLGAGPFGAHDQAGNVWEWCQDVYAPYDNAGDIVTDPRCDPESVIDAARVFRGGSWVHVPGDLRCAARGGNRPEGQGRGLGFRVVCRFAPST